MKILELWERQIICIKALSLLLSTDKEEQLEEEMPIWKVGQKAKKIYGFGGLEILWVIIVSILFHFYIWFDDYERKKNKFLTKKIYELWKLKKEISLKILPGLFSLTIEEAMKRTKGKMEFCSLRKERKNLREKIIFKSY